MKIKNIIAFCLTVLITTQALPLLVKAEFSGTNDQATLSLSLSAAEVNIGEEFSADIYLNTNGEDVVVVAAYLNYDADSFSVSSIDAIGSIFGINFEQNYDNVNGTVKLTRGEPTPGVNTASGLVATINFTATALTAPAADNITFDFMPGSTLDSNVILDDGQGTDILSGVDNARVAVTEPTTVSLTPATSTLMLGDTLDLILSVDNVTGFANIITDITYDDNILSFSEINFQDFENSCFGALAFEDDMAPGINIYAECWDGLSGDVTIATLRFIAVGEAISSPVTAENIMLVDIDWNDIKFEARNSAITVIAPDITAPVITVLGDNPVSVEKGAVYTDAGARAEDNIDGDITSNIAVNNPVDTSATSTFTVRYNVTDEAGNAAEEKTRTVNVIDTTPPARSNGNPAGSLTANTTGTTLSLSTDENAECRYSTLSGSLYASMTPMSVTGSTTQTQTVSGLANGQTYNYYVKCRDRDANANADDYLINFSVNNPAPAGGGGGGGGGFSPPPAPASVYPFKPENITAERTDGGMDLNWENPADINFQKTVIIRSTQNLSSYLTYEALAGLGEKIYEGAADSFTDHEIAPNLNYYYAFTAISKTGLAGVPVVILKSAVAADKPAPEKPSPAEPVGPGSRPKNLGGLPSGEVEILSRIEAEEVFYHNRYVNLNDTTRRLYALIVGRSPHDLNEQDKFALAFFIHEGSETTIILGAGERTGVLNSYLSVFGKLPRSEGEWQDIIKIANGRWPKERRANAENKAKTNYFTNVYKRDPDMNNPHDNAAVTVITYGLRPAARNLDSERAAIRIFRAIFRYAPESAIDWDIVRAVAYSGAIR